MQREVMLTGVGGQGIQLVAKTLALAAVDEGRHAMLLGHYAGAMRGGQTDASVVVGDTALRALPILPATWAAVVMHPDYWPHTRPKLRPHGFALVNSSLVDAAEVEADLADKQCTVLGVPAGDIAGELGAPMSAAYVLVAAFATITGMVGVDALVAAMRQTVPSYRTQHLAANEAALRAGEAAAPALAAPAWATAVPA